MRKFLIIFIPILILLLFVGIMTSGGYLKKPLGKEDRIYDAVQKLEVDVKKKEWEQSEKEIDYIEKAWQKIVNRIQFSTERDYMVDVSSTIAQMKGGVVAKDDKAILEEIYYFYDLWSNLAR